MNSVPDDQEQYLKECEVARRIALKPKTLEAYRLRGGGPKFYKIGPRLVRYRWSDVEAWLRTCQRSNTSQQEAA
jgi:predicted DNA-binding transcriptional regulator AlpA